MDFLEKIEEWAGLYRSQIASSPYPTEEVQVQARGAHYHHNPASTAQNYHPEVQEREYRKSQKVTQNV